MPSTQDAAPLHSAPLEEVLERLSASREGLTAEEAERRLEEEGPNRLPEESAPGWLGTFVRQFRDPLVYVLLAAAIVSAATKSFGNAAFIGVVLLVNAVVGMIQEKRASSSAAALEDAITLEARVLRDGSEATVEAEELVPGDIVLLETGDAVPADARLLEADGLRTDESLLTGESVAADKAATEEADPETPLAERETVVHAGSAIVGGRARAVVIATAEATELGRIAESLAEGEGQEPPLQVRMRRLTRLIAIFVLGAVIVLGGLELARGKDILQVFFLAVALAVSAIPAGLPIAITVALSRASKRMAEQNVVVRRLPAVEGLGACTLIASDKTGTLTANQLTARRLELAGGDRLDISGEAFELEGELSTGDDERAVEDDAKNAALRLAEAGALVNEGRLEGEGDALETEGDAVDVAFLVLARKLRLDPAELAEAQPRVAHLPFESERRFAASAHRGDEGTLVYVKGAAEVVGEMCGGVDAAELAEREEELAQEGFRVLAVAAGAVEGIEEGEEIPEERLEDLELLGLVGLIDPVREGVPEAVEACRGAGVSVRMVTGDHPATGLAIARALGIAEEGQEAITGKELEDVANEDRIARAPVFARVEPTQKTTIVERLQDAGHFVAVTGDGANDAPALRSAHIGVAMGEGGTDVARGAADLILTDDNFASIVAGIREGRIAYDNVRKVVWLLLATGAGEVILLFLALGFGLPLPLLPVQLLWLNLVTNGVQDVALAFERGDDDVLERGPRPPDEPVVDKQMLRQVLVSGAYIGVVGFFVFRHLVVVEGLEAPAARNLLLLLMVLFENAHIFSCRSERRSAFRVPIRHNPLLILTVLLAQGIHIASMYVPGLSELLGVSPVSPKTWALLLGIALTLLVVDEGAKLIERKLASSSGESGDESAGEAGDGASAPAAHRG